MRWIAPLLPTSTPTVGPFSTSTRARVSSHRPITTRCWLPPESSDAARSPEGVAIAMSWIAPAAARRPAAKSSHPARPASRSKDAASRLSSMERAGNRPSVSRSSGT